MNALLVDDERLARAELRRLLTAHQEIRVVGEAANLDEAERAVADTTPDLLFLDIQMPGGSGFDLLERLGAAPAVIFTTAYDAHAIRAFEVSALDYLLKPVEPERLAAAVERALARAAANPAPTTPPATVPSLDEESRVFVRLGERCWLVRLGDVRLFESEGNYTRLYFGTDRPLVLRSLGYLDERLDPCVFFRASRQHLVNLRWVDRVAPWFGDRLQLRLRGGGETVEMSRRQAQRFRELMAL